MKKYIFILLFVCSMSVYVLANNNRVEFVIVDTCATDSSMVTLLIKNNTSNNYYLPIINTVESDKWYFVLSAKDKNFFFLQKKFFNEDDVELEWCSENCLSDGFEEQFSYNHSWFAKRKTISMRDLTLLKSNSTTQLKIPVSQTVVYSDFCFWEIQRKYYKNTIKFLIRYPEKNPEFEKTILNEELLDELKKLGYQLYTDEIISNRIPYKYNNSNRMYVQSQRNDSINKAWQALRLERIKTHKETPENSIQYKYYEYCTPNLNILPRIEEFPFFDTNKLCSIKACFRSLSKPEINEVIFKRLVDLARANFKKKIYLCLISGVGSVDYAEKQNEIVKDDNKFIYISVDDMFDDEEIIKGIEIYNSETKRLLGNVSNVAIPK